MIINIGETQFEWDVNAYIPVITDMQADKSIQTSKINHSVTLLLMISAN